MNITETLSLIFTDQFVASLLLPINRAYIFDSVILLGRESALLAAIAAITGAFLGSLLNYGFGRLIVRAFFKFNESKVSDPKYRRFYYFLILIPFDFVGSLITFLAGFGHMRLRIFILASIATNMLYFLFKLV